MKHFLVLTNDNRHEIHSEKELKRINKIDEKFDGINSVSVICEVDPQKVADNRWTSTKPDFPCLFVAREISTDTFDESVSIFTCKLTDKGLIIRGSNLLVKDLTADEYFVIERH